MSELGGISGKQAIKAFQKMGYFVARQKGSHVILKYSGLQIPLLVVPLHKELKIGLLVSLIKDAGITVEQFLELL
jgi:predicted RNA binding protein YcfA (HicA-like mRNA interferase family)